MPGDSRPNSPTQQVLASDLDGTLIPLEGNEANRRDLRVLQRQIAEQQIMLAFVTGRHLEIVEAAIDEYELPVPQWIICDVGTSIYRGSPEGWTGLRAYSDHLAQRCTLLPISKLRHELASISPLVLQEEEKQGAFKLSYYVEKQQLDDVAARVGSVLSSLAAPYSLISSIDPFTGDGLIDILPRDVSKAYALDWWRRYCGLEPDQVVFAGDSGNDWAALVAGYRAIVVANADRQLARRVEEYHAREHWTGRLVLSAAPATSGVLDGCRAFGLIAPDGPDPAGG